MTMIEDGLLARQDVRELVEEDLPELTEDELLQLDPDLRSAFLDALRAEHEELALTAPQRLMHRLCGVVDEVMYGGAAGGGKSFAAVWHADWLSRRFPGHRTLILRSSFPELRRTIMIEARNQISEGRWRAADKEYVYENGSVVELGFCANEDDVRQYLSAQYECIIIDESTDLNGGIIEMLRSRIRTTAAKRDLGVNPHLLLLTNPGGPGHEWHRDRYVESSEGGRFVVVYDDRDSQGRGRDRRVAFVPARVGDNPFIDSDYTSNLVSISDPAKRAQYLDGDWSIVEGAFFSNFDPVLHVEEPFPIPPEWPIYGGYDWGFADPAVLLLAAVDFDGVLHVFHEMYETGLTAREQASRFRSTGFRPLMIAADPSIWRESGVGRPVSAQLTEAGMLPLRKASNERIAGWNRVREYLELDQNLNDQPRLRIFSTCANLIRTLPILPRDPKKPEDIKNRTDDHCLVAGTLVLTERGEVPIEGVVAGERVWTRAGWREVLAAGCTGYDQEVFDVSLSDGSALTATAGHPVWVEGRGFVPVDALRCGDILQSWHTANASSSMESSSAATQSRSGGLMPSTSRRRQFTGRRVSGDSTRRSGRRFTAPSLTGITFTMSTATRSTTTSRTWRASLLGSIYRIMGRVVSVARTLLPSRLLPRGIGVLRGGSGIASTVSGRGRLERNVISSARFAAMASQLSRPVTPGSVPTIARPPLAGARGSTTSLVSASAANAVSTSTSTPLRGTALVSVVSVIGAGRADVFNLTVADDPEFVANGVLVHNCADALRYLTMSRPAPALRRRVDPETYEERVQEWVRKKVATRKHTVHDVLGRLE